MERISVGKIAPKESEHDKNRNTPKLLYAYLKHWVKNVPSVGQYSTDWMNLIQYEQGVHFVLLLGYWIKTTPLWRFLPINEVKMYPVLHQCYINPTLS